MKRRARNAAPEPVERGGGIMDIVRIGSSARWLLEAAGAPVGVSGNDLYTRRWITWVVLAAHGDKRAVRVMQRLNHDAEALAALSAQYMLGGTAAAVDAIAAYVEHFGDDDE